MTAAIRVENVVKRFGDFEAVQGISLDVAPGETFGLLGPNGGGKSTLIRMMTTLIPDHLGPGLDRRQRRGHPGGRGAALHGVIPQALTSDINLTVEENLSIYAKLYSVPRPSAGTTSTSCWRRWTCSSGATPRPGPCPGGMRRRLEIARGLVHNPRIFFLDEPTTGLDPVSRVAVWEMLNQLKARAS